MSKNEKPNSSVFQVVGESNFGHTGYKVTATASEAQVVKLAGEGLAKLVSGQPSGRLDQRLGYNHAESKDVKRPDGWKRESISYSEATTAELKQLFTDFLNAKGFTDVSVETFPHGGGSTAIATAKSTLTAIEAAGANMGIEGFVAQWAKNIGYTGDNLTEDNVDFLSAIAAANAKEAAKKAAAAK